MRLAGRLAENTLQEYDTMLAAGVERLTYRGLDRRLAALGYEREFDSRCAGAAKNLTTGNTYASVTWGVRERDTKQSAFHFQSRRDTNFQNLQQLRQDVFVFVRGSIITI